MYVRDLIDKARRFLHQDRPSRALRDSRRRRLSLETLEGRTLLSSLPAVPSGLVDVISNDDSKAMPISDRAFQQALDSISNPSISGVALQIDWSDIEPTMPANPSMPLAKELDQKALARLSNLFCAAATPEPGYPHGKWVQLLVFPGFFSPGWVLDSVQTDTFTVQYGSQKKNQQLPLPLPFLTNTAYF